MHVWPLEALCFETCVRLGSSSSGYCASRLDSALSGLDLVTVGSSLFLCTSWLQFVSVWCGATGLSSVSPGLIHVGSSLLVRSFVRLGFRLSRYGITQLGSSLSVLDFVHMGSSLSLRSVARPDFSMPWYVVGYFGPALSVLDFVTLGSS